MKAVVFSLGCKVNECESASLIFGLQQKGYDVSDKLEFADLYIVNTCAVTKEAEKKSRQMQARIAKINPNAKVIFTGCASQKNPSAFTKKNKYNLVTGVFNKGEILNNLDKCGENLEVESGIYEEMLPVKSLKTRTFIKVQDGCNNFCSYCVIPYLRGRSRSRDPILIKNEILNCASKEVILTGINLSAYDYDGKGLVSLMENLTGIDKRIRLGSLEVNVITEEFLSSLQNLKLFAPQFHLSMQSGSNAVLKKMNRHYTREQFIDSCKLIYKYFPLGSITTDIIAGFPTETEQDFLDTIDLIDKVKFFDIHPFIFSPREGTVAYKMPDLPYEIKKDRLDRLLEKKEECRQNFFDSILGKTDYCVFEYDVNGVSEGYIGSYVRVYVDGIFKGIKKVKLVEKYSDGLKAEVIE